MAALICMGHHPIPGCGAILTEEDREYYSDCCETCMREWGDIISRWRAGEPNDELDKLFSDYPAKH